MTVPSSELHDRQHCSTAAPQDVRPVVLPVLVREADLIAPQSVPLEQPARDDVLVVESGSVVCRPAYEAAVAEADVLNEALATEVSDAAFMIDEAAVGKRDQR